MANPFTLSSLTGLAIAGAGLGLYLGSSAISEINPVHFRTAVSKSTFHADLVANRSAFDSVSALPATADTFLELGSPCVGCRTYPEEYRPVHDPAVDFSGYPSTTSRAEVIMAEAERYVDQSPGREALAAVERYSRYQAAEESQTPEDAVFAENPGAEAKPQSEICGADSQCGKEAEPVI